MVHSLGKSTNNGKKISVDLSSLSLSSNIAKPFIPALQSSQHVSKMTELKWLKKLSIKKTYVGRR